MFQKICATFITEGKVDEIIDNFTKLNKREGNKSTFYFKIFYEYVQF